MITDNYIKMCETNEDLQREWEHNKKDDYVKNTKGLRLLTWLPTLEQLWKKLEYYMFNRKYSFNIYSNWYNKRYSFQVFKLVDTEPDEYEEICDIKGKNIKECVIQILMRIKYNKAWTGEKWEAIT